MTSARSSFLLPDLGPQARSELKQIAAQEEMCKQNGKKRINKVRRRRRIEVAELQRVPYLYISLASKNPLRSLYEELGFVSSGNEYFRAKNL
jgi:hypothetical protein